MGLKLFGAVALFGAATIIFALSYSFTLSLVALLVMGASDTVSVTIRSTLVQLSTPDSMRGRVSAVNMLFIGASSDLGAFDPASQHLSWGLSLPPFWVASEPFLLRQSG